MNSLGVGIAQFEPEEYAAFPSETHKVGMPHETILAVVIEGMHDAERLESRLKKGNRSIQIPDGYEDVVEQRFHNFDFVIGHSHFLSAARAAVMSSRSA
jgi:hypothetical protein